MTYVPAPGTPPPLPPPTDFGGLLNKIFADVSASIGSLAAATAVALLPGVVLYAVVLSSLDVESWFVTRPDGTAEFVGDPSDLWIFFGGLLAAGLLLFLAQAVAEAAGIRIILSRQANQPVSWVDALAEGVSRLGSLLWIGFLRGLAIMGGLLLCVVPGVILFLGLVAAVPVLLIEETRGVDALKRSWELSKGRKGIIFGLVIIVGLAAGAVNFGTSLFVQAAFVTDAWLLVVVGLVLSTLVTSIVGTALNTSVATTVYDDSRRREFAHLHVYQPGYDQPGYGQHWNQPAQGQPGSWTAQPSPPAQPDPFGGPTQAFPTPPPGPAAPPPPPPPPASGQTPSAPPPPPPPAG